MLLAAIYVDPMHRVVLSDSQLERGKKAAVDIAVHMNQIENYENDMSEEQHTEHSVMNMLLPHHQKMTLKSS